MVARERQNRFSRGSEAATLSRKPARIRERVVIGLNDTIFAAWLARHLRRLGWGVHITRTADEVRQLVGELSPQVVVLNTRHDDQSGWLTCEKILRDDATVKVVLVESEPEQDGQAFAEFVGAAALIRQGEGMQTLIDEIVEDRPTFVK
jgi:DNA-binding NtrC family response regulator